MTAANRSTRPLAAIAVGGLVAGVLDILSAIAAYAPDGVTPQQVLQSVARGAIGRAAFEGGWPAAMLGLGFHFLIAFGAAAVYFLASRRLRFMTAHPVASGMVYGFLVFLFMRLVVFPLSAMGWRPIDWTSWQLLVAGPAGHLVLVGLPIALAVRHFAPHPDLSDAARPRPAARAR